MSKPLRNKSNVGTAPTSQNRRLPQADNNYMNRRDARDSSSQNRARAGGKGVSPTISAAQIQQQ